MTTHTTPHYTEGVCGDGVAILRDGVAMTIPQVLDALNDSAGDVARLHADKMELMEKYVWKTKLKPRRRSQ